MKDTIQEKAASPEAPAQAPCSALVISVILRKADELRLRPAEVWIDTYRVRLTSGNQSFDVGDKYETEAEAQWMAERLREALYRNQPK